MECPACGHEFLPGQDQCEDCKEDLTSLTVPEPKRGRLHEVILDDPLSQLNAPRPITLRCSDSAARAIEQMRKHRFGSVLVLDDRGRLAGIFTERDVLRRLSRLAQTPEKVPLKAVMTPAPISLGEDDSIAQALSCMAVGGHRHIPLVDDSGAPTGFVSIRGILRYLAQNVL
jgi:CBS domain-containing protein